MHLLNRIKREVCSTLQRLTSPLERLAARGLAARECNPRLLPLSRELQPIRSREKEPRNGKDDIDGSKLVGVEQINAGEFGELHVTPRLLLLHIALLALLLRSTTLDRRLGGLATAEESCGGVEPWVRVGVGVGVYGAQCGGCSGERFRG